MPEFVPIDPILVAMDRLKAFGIDKKEVIHATTSKTTAAPTTATATSTTSPSTTSDHT